PGRVGRTHRQHERAVNCLARGSGYALWLTRREAVLALASAPAERATNEPAAHLRLQLVGGDPGSVARAEDALGGVVNHYEGNDPSRWRTGVPTFARVRYAAVYPGIDLASYAH